MKDLEKLILKEISKPTTRGQQIKVGPSELAGCEFCVGETMAYRFPDLYPDMIHEESFGLAAWQGTAVHWFIENTFDIPGAIYERKLDIFMLEGYGMIRGSCDFYHPDWKASVDWKRQNKFSYDLTKLNGVSTVYRGQQHLYGFGWRQAGYELENVGICAIPGHSNKLRDVRFYWERYNQAIVDRVIERSHDILGKVLKGDLDSLRSSPDCYTCTRVTFRLETD